MVSGGVCVPAPDAKEVKNTLIKRGNESHGPDSMYIDVRHMVAMAPASPSSRVAQLIRDGTAQRKFGGRRSLNRPSFHDAQEGVSP